MTDLSPQPTEPQDETWLKDGILCQIYRQPVTYESVAASQKRAMELMGVQTDKFTMPMIVDLEGEAKKFTLTAPELGRLANHPITKHLAFIVLVGFGGLAMGLIRPATQLLFNNRVKYCDTLEEAIEVARSHVGKGVSVLDDPPAE
jgi:hypothetical protein